ncbi:MAG TPA: hypothetical protein VMV86_07110 [Methanosarcinales archaeon]|nr:hypothetical protein [Methanosarcinales archaeon]
MKTQSQGLPSQTMPMNMVGGNSFGVYPKISSSVTYNMFISDGWFMTIPGYVNAEQEYSDGEGRGCYSSTRLKKLFFVENSDIYYRDMGGYKKFIGSIDTFSGVVFIAENDNKQVGFCDKKNIYIYSDITGVLQKATLDFIPGYLEALNGYFISVALGTKEWRLCALGDGLDWTPTSNRVGELQSDYPIATVRIPGKSNNLFVMGRNITELWIDTGAALFPFQKTTSFNIDYGCINPETIAVSDEFVIWLGGNDKSSPVILYSSGGEAKQISSDGINYRLSNLKNPNQCFAFTYKNLGHLFYQLTFYSEEDNFTLLYDFTTKVFSYLSRDNYEHHIARKMAFFNNKYYFISNSDSNLYIMDNAFNGFSSRNNDEGKPIFEVIPRIRIINTFRQPDNSSFIVNCLGFIMEQGENESAQRVDLSISKDGGRTFSNSVELIPNNFAYRRNKVIAWNLGYANEFTAQFKFWGYDRFLITEGYLEIFQ